MLEQRGSSQMIRLGIDLLGQLHNRHLMSAFRQLQSQFAADRAAADDHAASFRQLRIFDDPPAPAPRVRSLRPRLNWFSAPAPESARPVSGFPRFPVSRFHSGGRRSYCCEPDAEDNPNIAAGLP